MKFRSSDIIWCLFLTVLFTLVHGYSFNTGDQAEFLPVIYQKFDPSLYKNDFFLTAVNEEYSVRAASIYLIYFCSKLIGVPWACFLLQHLLLFFILFYTIKIGRLVTNDRFTPYILPLLVFFVFRKWTVGTSTLFAATLQSGNFADLFAVAGMYYALQKKWLFTAVCLGITSVFHFVIGLNVSLLIGIYFLFKLDFKEIILFSLVLLGFDSVFLYQIFFSVSGLDLPFYEFYIFNRNGHHFLLSLYPIKLIRFLLLTAAGYGTVKYLKLQQHRFFNITLLSSIALLLIAWFCTEVVFVPQIAILQFLRLSAYTMFIAIIPLSVYMGVWLERNTGHFIQLNWMKSLFYSLLAASIGLGSFMILYSDHFRDDDKYHIHHYTQTDEEKLYQWIRVHTNKNDVFLTDPFNTSFSSEAQRATPVNLKALVQNSEYMERLKDSAAKYYEVDMAELKHQFIIVLASRNYNHHQVHPANTLVKYRIDQRSLCQFTDHLQVVKSYGDWVLSRVN